MEQTKITDLNAFYAQNQEAIDAIIQDVLENQQGLQEPEQAPQEPPQEDPALEQEMQAFLEEYPQEGIKTVQDFQKLKCFPAFLDYIKRGLDLVEAYRLANWQELQARAGERGAKSAAVKLSGKQHLKGTGVGAGSEGATVPREVMDLYHVLVKDWSEDKIRKHYKA